MYSNKQSAAIVIFGVFAALFLSAVCFTGSFIQGSIRVYTGYTDGVIVTTEATTFMPAEETTATMDVTEGPPADETEAELDESIVISEPSIDEGSTTVRDESDWDERPADETEASVEFHEFSREADEEPSFFPVEHLFGPDEDYALFFILLFLSLLFTALYALLMPRRRPTVGPDTAAVLLIFPPVFILSVFLPQVLFILKGNSAGIGLRLSYLLRGIFCFLVLFASFSLAVFSLRELVSWLCAPDKSAWPLRERLLKRLSGDGEKPGRHIYPAVFLMILEALLLAVSIFLLFESSSSGRRLFFRTLSASVCLLILFFFSLSSLISGLWELKKVRDSAIAEAVRNERLRVDLIANVSHDLRTPLTSIIGYGSLLEKEELSESARENLRLLNQKSAYMKDLVESLFELTKVSSGVLQCTKTEIDLVRLLEQTAGLFEDDLKEAGLTLKRHYCSESLIVISDGAFLSRVIANLLQNAVKYALSGTRIHLNLTKENSAVRIRMQNVSSYEMDFDPSEITERFTRGDEARTTKGSGLGLAIAKTYTEAVGGEFHVEIDGDVFSAVITLPPA